MVYSDIVSLIERYCEQYLAYIFNRTVLLLLESIAVCQCKIFDTGWTILRIFIEL